MIIHLDHQTLTTSRCEVVTMMIGRGIIPRNGLGIQLS